MADIKVSEFIINELSEEKLEELKDTNAVPPNEMFLTDEEGEQFTRGLPLGTIIPLAVVTDDPYLQPLDGRSLAQDGMYAEFCTWLKNRVLANSNNVPTCTIEEYATEMSTYSQCGKFVINDTNETVTSGNFSVPGNSIKLPTITEFIASNNGGDTIGLAELDEFKSHTHLNRGVVKCAAGDAYFVSYALQPAYDDALPLSSTGGSETRPKNIRYPYYIVVATSINDRAAINAEGVVSEVNAVKDVLSRTEQVEVIYDMHSNDVSINLGKTSGIPADTKVNIDMTKYKKLIVYAEGPLSVIGKIYTIDLQQPVGQARITDFVYIGIGTHSAFDDIEDNLTTAGVYFDFSLVNTNKTIFYYYQTGYTQGENVTRKNSDISYRVYKIEGVC